MDVNAAEPDGGTALAWAVHFGDRQMADKLLAAGAKVNAANEYGETPLTLACLNGDAALVAQTAKGRRGRQSRAVERRDRADDRGGRRVGRCRAPVDRARRRRERGGIPQGPDRAAVGCGGRPYRVVQLLIEKGADVKAASKGGFTALVFAATKNDAASVKTLLAAGADANYALPDGTKVLMAAAAHRSTAAAVALIDGGADPNLTDRAGSTLLHTAAQNGELRLIKKLIAKGVNIEARTPNTAMGGGRGGGGGFRVAAGGQTPLLVRPGPVKSKPCERCLRRAPTQDQRAGWRFVPDGRRRKRESGGGKVRLSARLRRENRDDFRRDPDARLGHRNRQRRHQEAQERICEVIRFIAEKGAAPG